MKEFLTKELAKYECPFTVSDEWVAAAFSEAGCEVADGCKLDPRKVKKVLLGMFYAVTELTKFDDYLDSIGTYDDDEMGGMDGDHDDLDYH